VIHLKCFGKWCRHQDSNTGPDEHKLVILPVAMVHLPFSKSKVSIKAAMNAAILYFPTGIDLF